MLHFSTNSIDPNPWTCITGPTTWTSCPPPFFDRDLEPGISTRGFNTVRTEISWQTTFNWLQLGAFSYEPAL
ncbi:hypothetical protein BDV39DRAFT_174126 [Aspergillus sergii]|uniref:Uncharacterized protein n=1 Tax=Aspergillus sergii TaxID=1034303 RepID=A0A5N6XAK7_9EURO|nr:hypothetical protein BDV39DRAFT_174126 [Aspergillus sergii]